MSQGISVGIYKYDWPVNYVRVPALALVVLSSYIFLSDVTFLPQGLQFHHITIFDSVTKEVQVLPYAEIAGVSENGFRCTVFSKENPGVAVLKRALPAPNFLPGYVLIGRLLQDRETSN